MKTIIDRFILLPTWLKITLSFIDLFISICGVTFIVQAIAGAI